MKQSKLNIYKFDDSINDVKQLNIVSGIEVAEDWGWWCGKDSRWYKSMREFGYLGGLVKWYCGYPQSKSAIPLTFTLYDWDGNEIKGDSRLKDIRAAIVTLKQYLINDIIK